MKIKIIILIFLLALSLCFLSNKNNEIVIVLVEEPLNYDVHTYNTFQPDRIARLFMGNLFDRDINGKLIPLAASSYKRLDLNKWEITLKKGIYFSNGKELTAKDVKYSLERTSQIDPKDFSTIEKIIILSKYKFIIKTITPDPLIIAKLVPMGYIVPYEDVVNKGGFDKYFMDYRNISGFGQYQIEKWERGKYIILSENKYCSLKKPFYKKIKIIFESDIYKRVNLLLSDKVDIIDNVPPNLILKIYKSKKAKIVKSDSLRYLVGNFYIKDDKSPLAKLNVRKALNYAIDRKKLIDLIYLGNCKLIPLIYMPQEFGFKPFKPYSYNPSAAESLLNKEGFENGLNLSLLTSTELVNVASALKKQFEKFNINLKIDTIERHRGMIEWLIQNKRKEDIFLIDPIDPMFDVGFHTEILISRYPRQNLDIIKKLDKIFYNSQIAKDIQKRLNYLYQIQDIMYENALYLFFWQFMFIYGISERVNYFIPYSDGFYRF